ncbi:MAG TPA: DUF1516 domain-containing protein [Bacillus bacterium]|uniref:UPF0344 protein J1TS3_03830 n=1 Tax=Siminovitchia fordii TaxID=254759 RepID=A0ABQ4K0F4_9BACI|nr:YisL family protein [Siminovitchia fordii]GIN19249.1 UPF0344 protein YisL [Siminovitchia fordii]HBZ10151.1 DUF1516 domain-containing protein [Bacillus sp. (in: firmicutes)]
MFDSTHAHITTWAVALILFVVVLVLQKSGKQKGAKITQMILRVFYLLIIATGVLLFSKHQGYNPALYGIKFLGGIIVIGMMEMILVRTAKEKNTGVFWAVFIAALAVTFFLGLKLPLGWNMLL